MKKLFSVLACIIILIVTASPAIANEPMNDFANAGLESYANSIIVDYINIRIDDLQKTDIFKLSQGYQIVNNNDAYAKIFFLFRNGKCIGKLIASYLNGEYISSFVPEEIYEITYVFENEISFTVFAGENSLFIKTSNAIYTLSGNESFQEYLFPNVNNIIKSKIVLSSIPFEIHSNDSDPNINILGVINPHLLGVPHVDNNIDPDRGKGLCWAASISSIGAYTNNDDSPLKAIQLYNNLKSENPNDLPSGNDVWESRAFEFYSIIPKKVTGGLTYSQVTNLIGQYKPIYVAAKNSDGSKNHGMVLCGYHISGDYVFYDIMDPNENNYVSSAGFLTTSTAKQFVYAAGQTTYSIWKYAMYER